MKIQQTRQIFSSLILSLLILGATASAQPAQNEPADSPNQVKKASQKQTVRTYDKFPDPAGDAQDKKAIDYDTRPEETKPTYTRIDEQNKDNNGKPTDTTVKPFDEEAETDE